MTEQEIKDAYTWARLETIKSGLNIQEEFKKKYPDLFCPIIVTEEAMEFYKEECIKTEKQSTDEEIKLAYNWLRLELIKACNGVEQKFKDKYPNIHCPMVYSEESKEA